MLLISNLNFGQTINLGTAANFVLFSTNGAVSNSGISHLTGNVGTNNGSSTAFGNVNGVMNDANGVSAQCASDLLIAYNQLNSTIPTFFPSPLLGNGDTLIAGVYSIGAASTLNLNLYLNANGDSNAQFIFQIQGAFSTNANSKVRLINGAKACNVFWKVEGLVDMASGTTMRGTVIANNAAINMHTNDTLEGRVLSTTGAVTVGGILAYTPIGCGSPVLNGPSAPALGTTGCYALFSSNGTVSNSGITNVTGDIGSNVGLTTGFNPLNVIGNIHPIPDCSTAACANDLLNVYTYLSTLSPDIELLYPAQFGNNLELTPHTYLLNAATVLTDSLYLNAQGNANGVFVIKIYGALSTSTYSRVKLINGAQSKNVYWIVEGAVNINNYSVFRGTIVSNNSAIAINTGVVLDGGALTTNGALSTVNITAAITPSNCASVGSFGLTVTPDPVDNTLAHAVITNCFPVYTLYWKRVVAGSLWSSINNTPNITGLLPATAYQAYAMDANGATSSLVYFITSGTPVCGAAITGLTASQNCGVITATWDASGYTSFTSYIRQVTPTFGASNGAITTTTSRTLTVPTSAYGQQYEISVAGKCGAQYSVYANPVYLSATNTPVVAPSPAFTATCTSITTTWAAVSGAVGYFVRIKNPVAASIFVNFYTTGTSYTKTGLPTNYTYEVWVIPVGCNSIKGVESPHYMVQTCTGNTTAVRYDDDSEVTPALSVFPNPNEGTFTLSLSNLTGENAVIEVMNLLGQTVYRREAMILDSEFVHEVVLPNDLTANTYLIRVSTQSGTYYAKMLKM